MYKRNTTLFLLFLSQRPTSTKIDWVPREESLRFLEHTFTGQMLFLNQIKSVKATNRNYTM